MGSVMQILLNNMTDKVIVNIDLLSLLCHLLFARSCSGNIDIFLDLDRSVATLIRKNSQSMQSDVPYKA